MIDLEDSQQVIDAQRDFHAWFNENTGLTDLDVTKDYATQVHERFASVFRTTFINGGGLGAAVYTAGDTANGLKYMADKKKTERESQDAAAAEDMVLTPPKSPKSPLLPATHKKPQNTTPNQDQVGGSDEDQSLLAGRHTVKQRHNIVHSGDSDEGSLNGDLNKIQQDNDITSVEITDVPGNQAQFQQDQARRKKEAQIKQNEVEDKRKRRRHEVSLDSRSATPSRPAKTAKQMTPQTASKELSPDDALIPIPKPVSKPKTRHNSSFKPHNVISVGDEEDEEIKTQFVVYKPIPSRQPLWASSSSDLEAASMHVENVMGQIWGLRWNKLKDERVDSPRRRRKSRPSLFHTPKKHTISTTPSPFAKPSTATPKTTVTLATPEPSSVTGIAQTPLPHLRSPLAQLLPGSRWPCLPRNLLNPEKQSQLVRDSEAVSVIPLTPAHL